jgi:hypothetical protein
VFLAPGEMMKGKGKFFYLFKNMGPDSFLPGKVAGKNSIPQISFIGFKDPGRVEVGPGLKGISALQFKKHRDLTKNKSFFLFPGIRQDI